MLRTAVYSPEMKCSSGLTRQETSALDITTVISYNTMCLCSPGFPCICDALQSIYAPVASKKPVEQQ